MGLNKVAFVGFNFAWVGNPKVPGAICAISFDGKRFYDFKAPKLVGFDEARCFIARVNRDHRLTLIAIDQPTIVPNDKGMRPVEKVAASIVSWLGGGVQPAYRMKENMFGGGAPIWKFLRGLVRSKIPSYRGAPCAANSLWKCFRLSHCRPSIEPSAGGKKDQGTIRQIAEV